MTIEEYCSKLNVAKEALSDRQIEEWGLKYCQGYPFMEIWDLGTEKDKRNAINAMRKILKEGGEFMTCYILNDDCIVDSSPFEPQEEREENFKIWIE